MESKPKAAPKSASIEKLFRDSRLLGNSSLGLEGWGSFAIERRLSEPGERAEENISDHFILLWDERSSLGERADLRGRFAPYSKGANVISLGPPGVLPEIRAHTPSRVIACTMDAEFINGVINESDLQLDQSLLHEQAGIADDGMLSLMRLLMQEVDENGARGALYAQSLFNAVALRFLLAGSRGNTPEPLAANPLPRAPLQRVVDLMHSGLGENVELAALANESGYSRAHFLRMFRAATGKTPHNYLVDLRIDHASRLLRESSDSLTDVALASGFSSHSHFAKIFRQRMGMTPSKYRRDK